MVNIDRDALVSILRSINDGLRPSFSYPKNVSHLEFENCMDLLEEKELIRHMQDSDLFEITIKGTRYLTEYDKIIELLCSKTRKREQIVA